MVNASELHVGGMSSIPTPGNNFHYFHTTPHGEEFAQLKNRVLISWYIKVTRNGSPTPVIVI